MENIDLNLLNYTFEDILKLFHLKYNYSYADLKASMKLLYKIHPDKSGLDKKYFIFFKEAYSILLTLFKHRNIGNKDTYREDFYSHESSLKLKEFIKDDNFNTNFNKLFEETFKKDTNGYDDWLKKSEINIETEDKNTFFNNKHNTIVVNNDTLINDINGNTDDNYINVDTIEDYSSNVFNKLMYDDVKKVYSETFIPVNENDERITKFSSVEQIKKFRNNDKIKRYTKSESEDILNKNKFSENSKINKKVFELLKEDEKNKD